MARSPNVARQADESESAVCVWRSMGLCGREVRGRCAPHPLPGMGGRFGRNLADLHLAAPAESWFYCLLGRPSCLRERQDLHLWKKSRRGTSPHGTLGSRCCPWECAGWPRCSRQVQGRCFASGFLRSSPADCLFHRAVGHPSSCPQPMSPGEGPGPTGSSPGSSTGP